MAVAEDKNKLAHVDDLFPPEVLAQRKALMDRYWAGENIGRPMIRPCSSHRYRQVPQAPRAAQEFAAAMAVESQAGWDVVPAFACDLGPVSLASAFGGEILYSDVAPPWIKPVVRQAEDVYRLKPPKVLDGMVGKAVDIYHYVLEHIEGYVPPRVPDMQGPLNTASLVWSQEEFFMAMYEHPAEVHHLLNMVTEHLIAIYKYFRDSYRDAALVSWPEYYMPQHLGIGMTEDLMPLLPAELYAEFGLPYVNRIAREFGGIYFHCCGSFKQNWPLVRQYHNLRGMDTMYPLTHPAEVKAAFPHVAHTTGLSAKGQVEEFPQAEDFLRFTLQNTPRSVRGQFLFSADDPEAFKRRTDLVLQHWAGDK